MGGVTLTPQQIFACLLAFIERDVLRAEIARRDAETKAAETPTRRKRTP